jgi:hypothetical protein
MQYGTLLDIQEGATLNIYNQLRYQNYEKSGRLVVRVAGTLNHHSPSYHGNRYINMGFRSAHLHVEPTGVINSPMAPIYLNGGGLSPSDKDGPNTFINAGIVNARSYAFGSDSGAGRGIITGGVMRAVGSTGSGIGIGIGSGGSGYASGDFLLQDGIVVNEGPMSMAVIGGIGSCRREGYLTIDGGVWSNLYDNAKTPSAWGRAGGNAVATNWKTCIVEVAVSDSGVFSMAGDLTLAQVGPGSMNGSATCVDAAVAVTNGGSFFFHGNNLRMGLIDPVAVVEGALPNATLTVDGGSFVATNLAESSTIILGDRTSSDTAIDCHATGRMNIYSGYAIVDKLVATNSEYSVIDLRGGLLEVGEAILTDCDLRTRLAGDTAHSDYGLIRSSTAPDIGEGATTLSITLDYAPASGECFTVIDNTSDDPVDGYFADDFVCADFGGRTYTFDVLYTAGDGNDIVLRETTPNRTFILIR